MSKAVKLMPEDELLQLLTQSRHGNSSRSITGMLLYIRGNILGHTEGRFIQVLEGTEEEVTGIFEKIQKDPRHYHITLLNKGTIRKRNFETWQMGFESLTREDYETRKGYFNLDEDFITGNQPDRLNVALNFLKDFYKLSLREKVGVSKAVID